MENEAVPSKNVESTAATSNLCISCATNPRALAFVPCAHFVACVSCAHSLKACPMCQSTIKAYVRIYE